MKLPPSLQAVLRELKGRPATAMEIITVLHPDGPVLGVFDQLMARGFITGDVGAIGGWNPHMTVFEITGLGEQALAMHDGAQRGQAMLDRFDLVVAKAREEYRAFLEAGHIPTDIEVGVVSSSHVLKVWLRAPFWEPAHALVLR